MTTTCKYELAEAHRRALVSTARRTGCSTASARQQESPCVRHLTRSNVEANKTSISQRRSAQARSFFLSAWNVTTTNKAFPYDFNTPRDDQMVAKVLSVFDPHERVPLASLDALDSQTQVKICAVTTRLFHTYFKLHTSYYYLSAPVLDLLMMYLLRHYSSLKQLQSESLAVQRLETCAVAAGSSVSELLSWFAHQVLGRHAQDQDTKSVKVRLAR
jgi:hypothetical protein